MSTLRELEAKHGAIPSTVEVITGGGGRHLYFKWPPGGAEIRNAQCLDEYPGIDWRGEGGYVLCPPSIHPSGRQYVWSVDSASEFADALQWLLDLVTAKTKPASAVPPMPQEWAEFMEQEHEGSRRSAAVAKLFGLLIRRNVTVPAAVALSVVQWFDREKNKEPLGETEVRRIAENIAGRELTRREKASRHE